MEMHKDPKSPSPTALNATSEALRESMLIEDGLDFSDSTTSSECEEQFIETDKTNSTAPKNLKYKNSYLYRCLEPPLYPKEKNGELYKPTAWEVGREVLRRSNIFSSKKNWMSCFYVISGIKVFIFFYLFFFTFFSWKALAVAFFVANFEIQWWEIVHHRGFTHRAFKFKNKFWLYLVKHFCTNHYPEELYEFSHHAHHVYSDQIADPYTPRRGLLYILTTHMTEQQINKNLNEEDYERFRKRISEYSLYTNSYKQYKKWGSVTHPLYYIPICWLQYQVKLTPIIYFFGPEVGVGYLMGKAWMVFCTAWVNWVIHGRGTDQRRPGIEFTKDWSYNSWIGKIFVGQWHSNHHLYPRSANTGFLKQQFDLPFFLIKCMEKMGIVYDVKDNSKEYMRDHYRPYQQSLNSLQKTSV